MNPEAIAILAIFVPTIMTLIISVISFVKSSATKAGEAEARATKMETEHHWRIKALEDRTMIHERDLHDHQMELARHDRIIAVEKKERQVSSGHFDQGDDTEPPKGMR